VPPVPPAPLPSTRRQLTRQRKRSRRKLHLAIVAGLSAGATVITLVVGLTVDVGNAPAAEVARAVEAAEPGAPTPTPSDTISMPAAVEPAPPIVRSAVVAADGTPAGPVTGGTVVTVTGTDLADVGRASFGDTAAQLVSVSADAVTVEAPPAPDLATGPVVVSLFDSSGLAVTVAGGATGGDDASAGAAATAAITEAIEPSATAAITLPAGAPATAPAPDLTFTYVPDPAITAQIAYVLEYWQHYNAKEYGIITGNDCVNFTSQSLIARGWTMDADWNVEAGRYSTAWASSTAFAAYLGGHPDRATLLTDEQRARVKVGDIVQFDWDNSGDRDHTGIVTRVEHTDSGVQISYAGHTNNTDYRSVDDSVRLSGGAAYFWSIH
jgi:hypothetical protein